MMMLDSVLLFGPPCIWKHKTFSGETTVSWNWPKGISCAKRKHETPAVCQLQMFKYQAMCGLTLLSLLLR